MHDDDLRRALESLDAPPPPSADWAAAARGRAKRRRRTAIAVTAAVTVAIAGSAVAVSLLDEPGDRVAPATEVIVPADVPSPSCDIDAAQTPAGFSGALPEGAVAVRLCLTSSAERDGGDVAAPPEALVNDVDDFVATVNALPPASGRCSDELAQPGLYAIGYPDGSEAHLATSTSAGCDEVERGGDLATGARELAAAFDAALARQRDAVGPPERVEPSGLFCPDERADPTLPTVRLPQEAADDPPSLVAGGACVTTADYDTEEITVTEPVRVTRGDLDELERAWRDEPLEDPCSEFAGAITIAVRVTDSWGDRRVVLWGDVCPDQVQLGQHIVELTPALRDLLARVSAETALDPEVIPERG